MNTTRRGLGGLLAGAAASGGEIGKILKEAVQSTSLGGVPPTAGYAQLANAVPTKDGPIAISAEDRLRGLLHSLKEPPGWITRECEPNRYSDPLDVQALKSVSPSAKALIAVEQKKRRALEEHRRSTMEEIEYLLRQNPLLRVLI